MLSNITNYIANINWSTPTWDLFIIIIFIIVSLLYGFSVGRDRLIVTLISTYMALAVVHVVPFSDIEWTAHLFATSAWRVGMFLGIFIVLFFLLSQSALMNSIRRSDVRGSWWQVILFGFLQIGLLISIIFSYLPDPTLNHFSGAVQFYFVSDLAKLFWVCTPIVLLILIRQKRVDG
jgi:hypothetical protein